MIINFNNLGGGGGTPSPSSSNYRVVDALSAITNPTEGLMAYVKSKTKVTNGIRFEITDLDAFTQNTGGTTSGWLGTVQWGDWDGIAQPPNNSTALPIRLSGNQFISFENDGNLHTIGLGRKNVACQIMYRIHNGEESGYGSYFDFYPIEETPWGDYKFWLNNGCSTSITTPYEEITAGHTYVYIVG